MYLSGFGNHHQSEAIKGALPIRQNSPQQCPHGLYAEQLSGSAFTSPRYTNLHSWLYRILPSVVQGDYFPYMTEMMHAFSPIQAPNPMRWSSLPAEETCADFIDGLLHVAGNQLMNAYVYRCSKSMEKRFFSNSDGEMLFVPYHGAMRVKTEFGILEVSPGMIMVIPRGVKFQIELIDKHVAGYLCENYASPLNLPQLGPIGANGLANQRHFLYPTADFEDISGNFQLICKYQGRLWVADISHSPLNVVAWHGNYAPYSYDLSLFNTINTVSFDHPDPSIFTVLTSESHIPGVANLDFVIFPPRWMVAQDTFRPPYFHRNLMNELMGLIVGEYDAKADGFEVGGLSIHNCMSGHGPDAQTYHQASIQPLKPQHYDNTLAFMFETREPWLITEPALQHPARQKEYSMCWQGLKNNFQR